MPQTIRYQGEDITFHLTLPEGQTWSAFSRVIVYAYTDPEKKIKFSTPPSPRYLPLTLEEDTTTLSGLIPSHHTTDLTPGSLTFEILIDDDPTQPDNYISIVKSDVKIKESTIKAEG